ncbi:MAG: pentapeptide repeat-containing protein [Eubacteriaceae bacterium]|jgi:uncharacterized protein YjbI with pentapeptide repeats|nr:pentapeptide repeat-containing protein [Eubacteriaceae bacterium]
MQRPSLDLRDLALCDDISPYLDESGKVDEKAIKYTLFRNAAIMGAEFVNTDFSDVKFEKCRFSHSAFRKCSFSNTSFSNCDISNTEFVDTNLSLTEFVGSKCLGSSFYKCVMRNFALEDSNFGLANFNSCRFAGFLVRDTDFANGFLCESTQKQSAFENVNFAGASFVNTLLNGVDLASCVLEGAVFSDNIKELKGASIAFLQWIPFARHFGVKIL